MESAAAKTIGGTDAASRTRHWVGRPSQGVSEIEFDHMLHRPGLILAQVTGIRIADPTVSLATRIRTDRTAIGEASWFLQLIF
jgi:hypothetical protein